MTRARNSANLASQGNLFVDITNDRTGIGSVVPAQNLHVAGTAGFHADVTFTGDLYNTTWDRSANTLKFVDNATAKFGDSGDLSIFHNGNSYIKSKTNDLVIYTENAGDIYFKVNNSETAIRATANGSVRLSHDNSTKFSTEAYGTNTTGTAVNDGLVVAGVATVTTMNVTGVLTYDDVTSVDSIGIVTARAGVHCTTDGVANGVKIGAGEDLILQHNGTDSFIDNNTGDLYLQTTGSGDDIIVESADDFVVKTAGTQRIKVEETGDIELGSGSDLTTHTGSRKRVAILGDSNGSMLHIRGGSPAIFFDQSGGNISKIYQDNVDLAFYAGTPASEGANTLRIDSSGAVLMGGTSSRDIGFPHKLQLEDIDTNPKGLSIISNRNTIHASHIDFAKTRGTSLGSNTIVQNDDYLGHINFRGADGTDLGTSASRISASVDGTPGSNNVPGRLTFWTQTAGGSITERLRIDSSGRVLVNTTTTNNGNNKMIIEGPSPSGTYAPFDGQLVLKNSETSGAINTGSALVFFGHDGGSQRGSGVIRSLKENGTSGNHNFYMSFLTRSNGGNPTERLRISSGGDMALGTSSPNSYTDQRVFTINGTTYGRLDLEVSGTLKGSIWANSGGLGVDAGGNDIEFYAGSAERLRITSDGYVQINADSKFLQIGASQDLDLHHNGTNSYIRNKTGDLHIRPLVNEEGIILKPNAAVELYHNNLKKFETTSWGNQITGGLSVNMATAPTGSYFNYKYGASASTESLRGVSVVGNEATLEVLATDGGDHAGSLILRGNNDGYAFINSCDNNRLEIVSFAADGSDWEVHGSGANVSRKDFCIVCDQDGAVELYNDNTKKFETGSSVNINSNHLEITSGLQLRFDNSSNNRTSEILNTGSSGNSQLSFKTNGAERLNITSTGRAIFTSDNGLFIKPATDSNDAKISFSTNNNNSNSQVGHFKYNHQDNNVVSGYGEGFILGGTESNGCVLRVDGGINLIDSSSAGGNGAKLSLGTDQDMRIYHSGGDGFIDGTGTGGLRIRYNDIIISNYNSSGTRRCRFHSDEGIQVFAVTNGQSNGARIQFSDASDFSQVGTIKYVHSDNAVVNDSTNECFVIEGSETQTVLKLNGRFYMDDDKFVMKPNFGSFDSIPNGNSTSHQGVMMRCDSGQTSAGNSGIMCNNEYEPLILNRTGNDGTVVRIRHQSNTEGEIKVNGSSVTYGNFMGSHKAQFVDHSKPDLLIGTVMEAVDQIATWKYASFSVGVGTDATTKYIPYYGSKNDGETDTITFENNNYSATIKNHRDPMPEITKHVCVKVSDTVGSKAVFGVFNCWQEENVVERESSNTEYAWNDLDIASIGNYFIRMQSGQTPAVGDYVESAGDGTAKVQSDDILRSKTIAKITSTTKQKTYDDGSFLVTCTLHCG